MARNKGDQGLVFDQSHKNHGLNMYKTTLLSKFMLPP